MKTVDPGDLAERTRRVEHHHEADWTARPGTHTRRKKIIQKTQMALFICIETTICNYDTIPGIFK